jgi:uncharacterized protein YraI
VPYGEGSELEPPPAPRRRRRARRGLGVDSGDVTGDNSGDVSAPGNGSATTSTTASTATTAPALPAPRLFKVTDGVNVRSGPGRTFPVLATVETGYDVLVVCAIDGESIDGPIGPTTKWVRIELNALKGYITNEYVATGPAINDPTIIGTCPSV